MEFVKRDVGDGAIKEVVQVSEASERDELMKIGHRQKSETFIPEIRDDEFFVYVDCPGYLDNRAPIINIANAVNIRHAFRRACVE